MEKEIQKAKVKLLNQLNKVRAGQMNLNEFEQKLIKRMNKLESEARAAELDHRVEIERNE